MNYLRSLFLKELFLSALGPTCFILGLVCTLFKYAQELWPIVAIGLCGCILTSVLKKRGLVLSLCVLACVVTGYFRAFWPCVLASSLALSWFLLLLGHQEAAFLLDKERSLISREQKELASSIDLLKKEIQSWKGKAEAFASELFSYQRKEKAFQRALEDAQAQLLKLKMAYEFITASKESDPAQEKSLQALEIKYAQLKIQFEEKADMLHKIRKELFEKETALLTAQKDNEERAFEIENNPLVYTLKQMEEENQALENHISSLEELVSSLLISKQTLPQPRKKKMSLDMDFLSIASAPHTLDR